MSMNANNKRDDFAIIITGPTASGKSDLAMQLADEMNGIIICCDSMQIYRGMDIGTAKPTAADRAAVPHRLFDIREPNSIYNVSDYVDLARRTAAEVIAMGKIPIFCGGTGQYISALAEGLQFISVPADRSLRLHLEQEYERLGGEAMLLKIAEFDQLAAAKLAPRDRKRIVRALEVWQQTGLTPTEINIRSRINGPEREYLVFACNLPRQYLYERINHRVDLMIAAGLEAEARQIRQTYPEPDAAFTVAIGYKEWLPYFDRSDENQPADRDKVVDKIRQNSRNYAKRQLSLLRGKSYVYWLNGTSTGERIEKIKFILRGRKTE